MQITINQSEIEQAIKSHIGNLIVLKPGTEIGIDLRAGRGENGYTAIIDVDFSNEKVDAPLKNYKPVQAEAPVEAKPPVTKASEPVAAEPSLQAPTGRVTMADLKRQQAEEAKNEETAPETEVQEEGSVELVEDGTATPELPDQTQAEEIESEEAAASTVRPSLFANLTKPKND